MNPTPHDLFCAYLQSRYRLGERDLYLSPGAVAALRKYRRPGAVGGAGQEKGQKNPTEKPVVYGAPPIQSFQIPTHPVASTGRVSPVRSTGPVSGNAHSPGVQAKAPAPVPFTLPEGDKATRLAFIAEAVSRDPHCRMLFQVSQKMVFGTGHLDAPILFVGEAPGEEEDLAGEPFVGGAGQLLNKMIQAMGLQRSEVYLCNICKFRPDMPVGATGSRKPTSAEMQACLPYLRSQISVVAPRVVVALGATAVEGLFSMPRVSIMKLRGVWMEWEGIPVMPTYHPAYLLRSGSLTEKRKVWEDLLQIMEKTGLPISDKQRGYFRQATSTSQG